MGPGRQCVQITCRCVAQAPLHHRSQCLCSSWALKRQTARTFNLSKASPNVVREQSTTILAGKSHDGKQRRRKDNDHSGNNDSSSASPSKLSGIDAPRDIRVGPRKTPSSSAASAPRVDPTSNIPVRHQIRLVREMKSTAAPAANKPAVRQRYIKKTPTLEEYREHKMALEQTAAELSKQESKNFALRQLYGTDVSANKGRFASRQRAAPPPPVLLVDGYNVLMKMMETMDSWHIDAETLGEKRDAFVEALGVYSQVRRVRVVVAFDALKASTGGTGAGGEGAGVTQDTLSTGVTVVWCRDREADTYIEAQVGVWLERQHPYVVVATSDALQRTVVESNAIKALAKARGKQTCFVIPASGLVKDLASTKREVEEQVEAWNLQQEPGRMNLLGSAVKAKDRDAFSAMQAMRLGLFGQNERDS